MIDPYWRRCEIDWVVDGDTLDLLVDLGYHVHTQQRMRLLGIDTPEVRGPTRDAGNAAAAYAHQWILDHGHSTLSWPFRVRSEKADSFGRFLADVECGEGHSLSADLLASAHAVKRAR